MKGKIVKINWKRGFGFIIAEDDQKVFFHSSALAGVKFDSLNERDEVAFDIVKTKKGLSAVNIKMKQ